MLGIPLETAIIAALIGFAAALLGQFIAVFLGARYSANLNRRTQLELADIMFERQWRGHLVQGFLDLAARRLGLVSEFTSAVAGGDSTRAFDIAGRFQSTEAMVQAAGLATLGDEALTAAGNAWMETEHQLAEHFAAVANRGVVDEAASRLIVTAMIDLVDKTGRLTFEAGRFVQGSSVSERAQRRRWPSLRTVLKY